MNQELTDYDDSTSSHSVIETDLEIIRKLLFQKPYTREDVIKCTSTLLIQEQCEVIQNSEEFDKILEKFAKNPDTPIFVIHSEVEDRWALTCLLQDQNQTIKILHKNPSGDVMDEGLQEQIDEVFPNADFIFHMKIDLNHDEDYCRGPICLRNLNFLANYLQEHPKKCVDNFNEIRFFNPEDLVRDKFELVMLLTDQLARNQEFRNKFKEFVDNLPLVLCANIRKYRMAVEAELQKDNIDFDNIREARWQFLKKREIEKFKNDYRLDKKEDYMLDIQTRFPDEMEIVRFIFEPLENIKVDKLFWGVLQHISDRLDIDYEFLKAYYELNDFLKEFYALNDKKANSEAKPTRLGDIDEIARVLPKMRTNSKSDNSSKGSSQLATVREMYKKWQVSKIQSIHEWARTKKGCLRDRDVNETIAIMDRAWNLLTGGDRLRDAQVLALLTFHSQKNKVCEIKSGEGKAIIVSLLAVLKALEGCTVDVVTSNPILTVRLMKTFYSAFNLTVATTSTVGGYTADVLYGTINNFQCDYHRVVREKRKLDQVILDEIDGMFVGDGLVVAAPPYPGMDYLMYAFIKIWQELHKVVKRLADEIGRRIRKLLTSENKSHVKTTYEKMMQEVTSNERATIETEVLKSTPTHLPLIPTHLKNYVKHKLEVWVSSAVHAKFDCLEHLHYRIIGNEVVVLESNLPEAPVWSNGLHQFVQLKHNLPLTLENLTSNCISNVGYLQNYQNIFGLTSVLGSRAEQEFLTAVYCVDFVKLPTSKPREFEQLPELVVDDACWHVTVTLEIFEKIDDKRAVLVVCATKQDLLAIKADLKLLRDEKFRLQAGDECVRVGHVIITTAPRAGINLKIDKDLEKNGGLHVCVAFLPSSQRIEALVFEGPSRTGQLIIKLSEVTNPDMKSARDDREAKRLERLKEGPLKELAFKDELWRSFRNLTKTRVDEFVARDLEEFWVLWLEARNPTYLTSPAKEFARFEKTLTGTLHNPFYAIEQADRYLETGDRAKAKNLLESIKDKCELLAGVHLKLFEIALADGGQRDQKVQEVFAEVFEFDRASDANYKNDAHQHLHNAKVALRTEIDYVEHLLESEDFRNILTNDGDSNPFLRNLCLKINGLKACDRSIDKMLEEMAAHDVVDVVDKIRINNSELEVIGLGFVYSVGPVVEISGEATELAQLEILAGITALCIGLCFHPAYPPMKDIAGTLIPDGMTSAAIEVISNKLEYNQRELARAKFMVSGTDLIEPDVAPGKQCSVILCKATSFCHKLSVFKQSEPESMPEQLTNFMKASEDFEESLQQSTLLADAMIKVATELVVKVPHSITDKEVIIPLLRQALRELASSIDDHFQKLLRQVIVHRKTLMQNLHNTKLSTIDKAVEGSLTSEDVIHMAAILGSNFLIGTGNSLADVYTLTINSIVKPMQLKSCIVGFVYLLESQLTGGVSSNDVDEVVEGVCARVAHQVFCLFAGFIKEAVSEGESGKELLVADGSDKRKDKGDFYSTLRLPPNASIREVKRSHRRMVLEFHPDRNPDDPYAEDKFRWINIALAQILKRDRTMTLLNKVKTK